MRLGGEVFPMFRHRFPDGVVVVFIYILVGHIRWFRFETCRQYIMFVAARDQPSEAMPYLIMLSQTKAKKEHKILSVYMDIFRLILPCVCPRLKLAFHANIGNSQQKVDWKTLRAVPYETNVASEEPHSAFLQNLSSTEFTR